MNGDEMTDDMRITRLEESEGRAWKAIESLAEKQEKLDDALVALLESQIKTEERFRETDARMRELASSMDERIGKLVSAIHR
jgi:hypothetical protein